MRLFLAVDLPKKVKEELNRQLANLRVEYPNLRWTPKENFHLTLQFYGDIKNPDALTRYIEESTFDVPGFDLYATDCSLFIDTKIVLYLNFVREKNLELVVGRMKEKLQIEGNKKIIPHIAFARYKIPSKQQYLLLKKKLQNLSIDLNFPVTRLYLFESIIRDGKPHYKKVAEFPLVSKN